MAEIAQITYVDEKPVIRLQGRITLGDGSMQMRDAVDRLLATGVNQIILNMAGVTFIDSTGIGGVATSFVKARNVGGTVCLCHVPETAQEVLAITGLIQRIPTFADEAAALAHSPAASK